MEDLSEFINNSKARLKQILYKLQWTKDSIESMNNSPPNLNESGEIKEFDEPLFPPSYENQNSIVLDQNELRSLLQNPNVTIPEKFSDLQLKFTREEKLRLYEEVARHKPEAKITSVLNEQMVAIADIVAIKNREKKKRRKHRISKPTHIEEVRSLVELQMQALQQYLETKPNQQSNIFKNRTRYDNQAIETNILEKKERNKDFLKEKSKSKRHSETYRDFKRDSTSISQSKKYDRHKESRRSRSRNRFRERSPRRHSPKRHKNRRSRSRSQEHRKMYHTHRRSRSRK